MLQVGSLVDGKYKVLGKIGQGGMSVVYLALNERANKTWAIKEVCKDSVHDFATACQGLIAETNILKGLNHKYLPSIVDVIDDGESFLIVMDYIQGKSLKEILKETMIAQGVPIGVEDVISWGKQLCDVLYYLHTRPKPIIYRDMKPANVMLKPDGEISLIDFGTARVFKTGNSEDTICLGTPGYAAPEQYGGNGQTRAQTDIYCLGATMHHLITGRDPAATPFNFPPITQCRPTLIDETSRALRNTLLGLEIIIQKCTQYDMKERYQTCAELRYDLDHPEEFGLPHRKKLKHRIAAFSTCAGISIFLGTGAVFGTLMENSVQKSGYDYYISGAAVAPVAERFDLYEKAIALNPTREDAYLFMLDTMLEDNEFSTEDDIRLISILNSRYNNRRQDNKAYFQTNKSGYVEFSYQLGLAYYYSVSGSGDKSSAVGWFNNVTAADMSELDFGENNEYKERWQTRARILGKISSYYKNKLGVTNQMGDAEVSYLDYWNDLMFLMDDDIADKDNIITELRLYNEIVYQIYTRTLEFKNGAGLTEKDLNEALSEISKRLERMNTAGNQLAKQLVNEISENISLAEKNVVATYSSGGMVTGDMTEATGREGGQ